MTHSKKSIQLSLEARPDRCEKPCESHDLACDSFHSSLLVLKIIDGELYALYLGEVLQGVLRFLPPPATCLVTTEGRGVIELVPTIHPHRAGLEASRWRWPCRCLWNTHPRRDRTSCRSRA